MSGTKRFSWVVGVVVVGLSLSAGAVSALPREAGKTSGSSVELGAAARSAALFPLSFVENRGQWSREILFAACRGGMVASFLEDGFHLHVAGSEKGDLPRSIRLTFEGGCPSEVTGETSRPTLFSFLHGPSARPGRSGVQAYESILYRGLHPGVDVRIRDAGVQPPSSQIEYDLLLGPGVAPEEVVIRCEGIDSMHVSADGSLVLTAGTSTVRQPPPVAWQDLPSGERRFVTSRFVQLDAARYTLEVPDRDGTLPLVVDPVVVYATYLGGSGEEFIYALALRDAEIVVAGFTSTAQPLPATASGQSDYRGGRYDGFVARLDLTLETLHSFSFLGGSGEDRLLALALTGAGDIVVAGQTSSTTDFPTTEDALQATCGGYRDGFLTVLNPAGTEILYSTYLGGLAEDGITSLATDSAGRIVAAGFSTSPDFASWPGLPAPQAGFRDRNAGGSDVIVLRLNVDPETERDDRLEYATFLGGGAREEHAESDWESMRIGDHITKPDIVLRDDDTVVVTGTTYSIDFPTTSGAYRRSRVGDWDAFVTHLSLDGGGEPFYSTYLGGPSTDAIDGVALDPSGDVWVTGFTWSGGTSFPTTPDAYARTLVANDDVFLTRLRLDGSLPPEDQLVYSTLIGGGGWDFAQAVAVNERGEVTVVGDSISGGFPSTEPGGGEGFVMHFTPAAGDGGPPYDLAYSRGGILGNNPNPMAVVAGPDEKWYVAGYLNVGGLPVSDGVVQPAAGGLWESGILVLDFRRPTACFTMDPEAPDGDVPLEVRLDAGCSETPGGTQITTYRWTFDDGTPEVETVAPEVTHVFVAPGVYHVTLTVVNDAGPTGAMSQRVVARCAPPDPGDLEPWISADIGEVKIPGSARWTNGDDPQCLSLCASGKLLASLADRCHFVHQHGSGNFALEARIPDMAEAAMGAQIGVMVRESLADDARFASMSARLVRANKRFRFNFREQTGGSGRYRSGDPMELPGWVRIERVKDTLTGYSSSDGETWKEESSVTFADPLADDVLLGILAIGGEMPEGSTSPALQAEACDISISEVVGFTRGNVNGDNRTDLSDAIFTLSYLYLGTDEPSCKRSADCDDNGILEITDAILLLGYLYLGTEPPSAPFPHCGTDHTPDGLSCESYPVCESGE